MTKRKRIHVLQRPRAAVAPEPPGPPQGPSFQLPPKVVEALTGPVADPWALYGQALAENARLVKVINTIMEWLGTLAEEAKASEIKAEIDRVREEQGVPTDPPAAEDAP